MPDNEKPISPAYIRRMTDLVSYEKALDDLETDFSKVKEKYRAEKDKLKTKIGAAQKELFSGNIQADLFEAEA